MEKYACEIRHKSRRVRMREVCVCNDNTRKVCVYVCEYIFKRPNFVVRPGVWLLIQNKKTARFHLVYDW